MEEKLMFCLNSILFGIGLAMDAFSVSMANGLHEPRMKTGRMCLIAGTFGLFQVLMPLLGWVCVHTVAELFTGFHRMIPWIALLLLGYIGGKMLLEGLRGEGSDADAVAVSLGGLLLQGIATSIDALSVGFTIAEYDALRALSAGLIIAGVTFVICVLGLRLGQRFGTRLSARASLLGGGILIAIGIEIFVTGIMG